MFGSVSKSRASSGANPDRDKGRKAALSDSAAAPPSPLVRVTGARRKPFTPASARDEILDSIVVYALSAGGAALFGIIVGLALRGTGLR